MCSGAWSKSVITSYSIHYTKLYDIVLAFLGLFEVVVGGIAAGGAWQPGEEAALGQGQLLDEHRFRCYTEHLSYCSDDGHLYDLMPIPFTEEAVHYVV